ncbi:androglobin-like isoform X2 [Leptinotarsa decemlineata]|uniref:androglobin-like isoform X2 n=1 Tax=Leptinotarsa decemlineata TaxID=7539 RepID=UPI003D30B6A7
MTRKKIDSQNFSLYEDPQTVHLPPSIHGHEWKRSTQLFPDTDLTIYNERSVYPDLMAGSQHLLDSEFVRSFISSIEILCYLGSFGKFPSEYTSSQFVSNTDGQAWKPWHHIYSNCRAGKVEKHTPSVNKSGKYIVRIFWMGCWRKVYVDDFLPLDTSQKLMLPSLQIDKQITAPPTRIASSKTTSQVNISKREHSELKKIRIKESNVVEMWPFLLSKALMKVASLTWTDKEELNDFDIIQCLTGWMPFKMYTGGLGLEKVWDFCRKHTTKFSWPEELEESKSKKLKSVTKIAEEDEDAFKGDCYLTLCYSKPESKGTVRHSILVDQSRDIPLIKPSKKADFPRWKQYRWLDWAIEKQLIPPLESSVPIRCLKTVDPFRSVYDNEVLDNQKSRSVVVESITSHITYGSLPSVKSLGAGRSRGNMASKSKEKSRSNIDLLPDISKWIDLEQIFENIKHLTVYYKPSKFNLKVRISNISCDNITKKTKSQPIKNLEDTLLPNWKEIIRPEKLLSQRNEPISLFRDSLSQQTIVINLTQTGYQPVLEKDKIVDNSDDLEELDSECSLCTSMLLQRVIDNIRKKEGEFEVVEKIVQVSMNRQHYQPQATLVIGSCRWRNERVDDFVDSLTSFGSRSVVLKLKPGKQLFNLWIKSEMSYVTQILSDGALCVGTLEEIYPLMAEESRSLEKMAKAVTKCFETMVKSFGKPEFQARLREYYSSYKPQSDLDKYELKMIHEAFYDELKKLVTINMGEDELEALKIGFREVQFPTREQTGELTEFCYPIHQEDMKYVKIMEKAALTIQSFFRSWYVRALLKRHKTSNKHYKKTGECLQRIYYTLFSEKGGLNLGTTLLRNFLNNENIYDFRKKYQCYEDNRNTIALYPIPNVARSAQKGWIVLRRQVFFVNSYMPLLIRIKLFCDLSNYIVRAFNNDTGYEVKIFTNNVVVAEYPHNCNGYTILCYGWTTTLDPVVFKLALATNRVSIAESVSFPSVLTKTEILKGHYIPNTKGRICKYRIMVRSEFVLLTIHFTTDYPEAKVLLRLQHRKGTVVQEISGIGGCLVPSVMLENLVEGTYRKMGYTESMKSMDKKISKSKFAKVTHRARKTSVAGKNGMETIIPDIYYIEAFVDEDSWPLSANEWQVVEKLKKDLLLGDPLGGEGHHKRNDSKSPTWAMEMIFNAGDSVAFLKDDRQELDVKMKKMSWYEKDSSRYQRSQDLRNNFLEENKVPNLDFCESLTERSLNPNIFQSEIIEPYDITKYLLVPVDSKGRFERKLKTAEDLEKDSTNEFNRMVEFTDRQTKYLADLEQLCEKQVENFNIVQNWYNDCRNQSRFMMESAYSMKQKYAEKVIEEGIAAKKETKKGTKGKK